MSAPGLSLDTLLWAASAVSEWLDDPRCVPADFGGPRSAANRARRVLKVTEEAGEVFKAWSKATGENPRLGVAAGWDEVERELADTAMAALAGLFHLTGSQEAVRERLREAALKSASRAGAWHLEQDGSPADGEAVGEWLEQAAPGLGRVIAPLPERNATLERRLAGPWGEDR